MVYFLVEQRQNPLEQEKSLEDNINSVLCANRYSEFNAFVGNNQISYQCYPCAFVYCVGNGIFAVYWLFATQKMIIF